MLRLYKLSWSICFLHALFPAFASALPSASARYSDKTVSELARMLVPTAACLSIALMKCLDVRPSAANELGSSELKFWHKRLPDSDSSDSETWEARPGAREKHWL